MRTPPEPSPDIPVAPSSRTPPSSCCSSRTPPPSARWETPSTFPRTFNAGCCPAPGGTGCFSRRAHRFPVRIEATPEETEVIEWRPGQHGQRPLPPPVESATTDASESPLEKGVERPLIEAEPEEPVVRKRYGGKKGPVLLSVTPPRTQASARCWAWRTCSSSIAVPEPFALELAADMDGVTLMARCLDAEVVRGQLSAHYPQARIRQVGPGDDPLQARRGRAGVVHHAAGRRTGVRPDAHIQRRRPARSRLRPPSSP